MDEIYSPSNIGYFITNNFVANIDSYPSHHPNNFFLREFNGELTMIPWDYNSAFGIVSEYNPDYTADMIVNQRILESIGSLDEDERIPMWEVILEEEYRDVYIDKYEEFLDTYFSSGEFNEKLEAVYNMIKPYVKKDPTAYFGYEQFEIGYSTLKEMISRRVESLYAQIDEYKNGTPFIPVDSRDLNHSELGWKYFGVKKDSIK